MTMSLKQWEIRLKPGIKCDFFSPLCEITLFFLHKSHFSTMKSKKSHISEVWSKGWFHESNFYNTFKVCSHVWLHVFFAWVMMKKVPYWKAPGLAMHFGQGFWTWPPHCKPDPDTPKASDWKTKLPFPSNINL